MRPPPIFKGKGMWSNCLSSCHSRCCSAQLGIAECKLPRRAMVLLPALGLATTTTLHSSASGAAEMLQADTPRFRKTLSGLRIQDVLEGSGQEATEGNLVEFDYVCRRSNGYYVYSTMDAFNKNSEPVILLLDKSQVIPGLVELIVGMKPGGKRRALVPPELGYVTSELEPQPHEFGAQRSLMAHAKEPLVFEVQLLKVK